MFEASPVGLRPEADRSSMRMLLSLAGSGGDLRRMLTGVLDQLRRWAAAQAGKADKALIQSWSPAKIVKFPKLAPETLEPFRR